MPNLGRPVSGRARTGSALGSQWIGGCFWRSRAGGWRRRGRRGLGRHRHHSGATIAIDIGVLDFLASVMDSVGATSATILSAYRTRETNAMLARTTFGVADNSQHIYGRALDIRLATRNEEAMQAARAMLRGGVGWYPRSSFFHLDSGPVRNWTLNGAGLDRLLLEFRRLMASGRLAIAPKGQLLVPRARAPLSVRQRLALHHALAKAEFAAARH